MLKQVAFALSLASFALVARPSEARTPLVTITHAKGYGFFQDWGTLQTCPGDPSNAWTIHASLNFQLNSAGLLLSFSNNCNGATTLFSADGTTDASQLPFTWDFKQRVAFDQTLGRDGLIAWATYQASIPMFDEQNGCYMVADVNVRLDQQGRAQQMPSFTHTSSDGLLTVSFSDFIFRPTTAAGTIHLRSMVPGQCEPTGLPNNFAIYPQVFAPFDGSPLSIIFETIDATITRRLPGAFPPVR